MSEDYLFIVEFALKTTAKKKNCVKGVACGNACIAANRKCRKETSPTQKAKIEELIGKIDGFTQKTSKDGFLRGTAKIPVQGYMRKETELQELKGEIKGDFIVTRTDLYGGFYTTTHIPTGLSISGTYNENSHKMSRARQKQFVDNLIKNKVKFPKSLSEVEKLTTEQRKELQQAVLDAYQ